MISPGLTREPEGSLLAAGADQKMVWVSTPHKGEQ